MLNKKVEGALNKQIAMEAHAATSYLSMASWSEKEGLAGCARFFYAQSEEERGHMLKIVRFVNECGGHALIPAVEEPANKYKSLKHIIETALAQEKDVTRSINRIVALALEEEDFAAFKFLEWYVEEQVEEEAQCNQILDMIRLAGESPVFLIDRAIGEMKK